MSLLFHLRRTSSKTPEFKFSEFKSQYFPKYSKMEVEHIEMEIIEKTYVIPDLDLLIEPNMMCEKSRITNTKYSRLNDNSEDNHESTLLKIDVTLINSTTGEDGVLSMVAKIPSNQREDKNLSHIRRRFKNEVGIYMSAKRAVDTYLREKGIKNNADFFATPFGGRINLNGDDTVDHDAVLVLQNYDNLAFKTLPCRTGFDLDCSKLILKAIAKFHASFFGLKIHAPKEFNEKVKPYLTNFYIPEHTEKIAGEHMIQVLKEKDYDQGVINRAVATFNKGSVKEVREPYGTFTHNNMSVNNILLRFDKNGKPKHVKLLDFAISEYSSPLRDLLFFLFSSVELGILKIRLDDLIDSYYYSWISILKRLNIDQNTKLFCRLEFNREVRMAANQSEFYHILCMLYAVLGRPLDENCDNTEDNIPELKDTVHKKRMCSIINEFHNRGWLDI